MSIEDIPRKDYHGPVAMTDDQSDHAAFVDAWLERSTKELAPDLWLDLFAASLEALWKSVGTTLGEVTLHAIVDRVLHNARQRFPFLAALQIEANGAIQAETLRTGLDSRSGPEMMNGIRFLLVEFLTVIGNLTAEILTPELHAELSKVALPRASHQKKGVPGTPARPDREHTEDEDGKQ